jgi:hypothetical protein
MGREILGDDHTGIDFEHLDYSTGTVIFWIAIPVLGVKHNHVFTHGTGNTLNALDGTSFNKQWARCIRVANVGEDGTGVAIVGGGQKQRGGGGGRENNYCRPLLFDCTGTGWWRWG